MHEKTAIIYEGTGADPDRDRMTVLDRGGDSLLIIPVGQVEQVGPLAQRLVNENITAIQLCGGMPARTRAELVAAFEGRAVIGAVTFGIESLERASEYGAAFVRGEPPREAFIIVMAGWEEKRLHRAFPPQDTTFAIVADDTAAARVAGDLAAAGVGLIEVYGSACSATAAAVIEAVNGRAAVGAVGYDRMHIPN